MAQDELGVLSSTAYVVQRAQNVRIDPQAVENVAARIFGSDFHPPRWDVASALPKGTAVAANYILVLDALNFCFWPEPRWRVNYGGAWLDGYRALVAALRRALEEGVSLLDAEYLAGMTRGQLAQVLRGENEPPLLDERLANLREVGQVLLDKYGGGFAAAIEQANGSAVRLVQIIVNDFSSFDDVARYNGQLVRMYKRAQICVGDLYGAYAGRNLGQFVDLDRLTAFADYKVPQILRHFGVLRYSSEFAGRIDAREPIDAGSADEVEIRSATVWAMERLRQVLAAQGVSVRAFELDWYLWELSQSEPAMKPYHRARTKFY